MPYDLNIAKDDSAFSLVCQTTSHKQTITFISYASKMVWLDLFISRPTLLAKRVYRANSGAFAEVGGLLEGFISFMVFA